LAQVFFVVFFAYAKFFGVPALETKWVSVIVPKAS